jgi:hypothetical protein
MRRINDDAACCNGGGESLLRLVARHRDVDVHGVAQRLRCVELLHPHRGAVAEGIDRVVTLHRRIAEHRAPERKIDGVGFGRDGELHLVDRRAVGDRPLRSRQRSNCTR